MSDSVKRYKKNPPSSQKILLGVMGERIVASILRKEGRIVEESLNVFDEEKDMLVDGKKVEVKTQVPYMMEDSFAVPLKQVYKIMKCHKVYFVSVPMQKTPDDLEGCVFEFDPSNNPKAHRVERHDGEKVTCFPRRQDAMRIIHRITDEGILSQLRYLSTSYL